MIRGLCREWVLFKRSCCHVGRCSTRYCVCAGGDLVNKDCRRLKCGGESLEVYCDFKHVCLQQLPAFPRRTFVHVSRINSANRWRYLQFVGLSIHAVYTVAHAFEPDPALFAFTSKLWGGLTFLISVMCTWAQKV